ncbi:MAG: 1-(5-phosphoribosyl)-5-[(5-phosphoribosylamino)methylideneamino]imidazole-4-carboxamide isomerase [Candidatus Schekmanbacteria bacterium RBG_16_38_10]|uniref:1-(5-phosphoribosyl)-5-[(5-phosphoribosylamino)methylideneamino] imidazole-4-carboxamide isomerase n=1 Tax=Candidatus Schekmanbacteria bacterium RBG_16_38_10 TaxID=1817879 RepID=A0A1F7S268_9BACT|nr:MAG: 1-(5-phosphoribosyl)-5-[(5-phosphoribosylamino)methylideneamino]imidazole-4-carboxamide isomerase [Candidatus Schekmanbacteria bacterium RBG_16_38_10]
MLIIPAIDLKGGKCVRLIQGKMDEETVFSDSPLKVAKRWEKLGAKLIHVVDLDGAVSGKPGNKELVAEIARSLSIPVQIGGGIRDFKTAQAYFLDGIDRIILGTVAYDNIELVSELCKSYPGKIIVGIDAKNGMVAIKGWVEITEKKAIELAKEYENLGVAGIIYTDISKDGMMIGPNIDAIKEFASAINIPVIASGGVSNIDDLKKIAEISHYRIKGVIVGKALYTGAIDLREAIRVVNSI